MRLRELRNAEVIDDAEEQELEDELLDAGRAVADAQEDDHLSDAKIGAVFASAVRDAADHKAPEPKDSERWAKKAEHTAHDDGVHWLNALTQDIAVIERAKREEVNYYGRPRQPAWHYLSMHSRRWFTADHHFGHLNVAIWRGFLSLGEMRAALIRRWHERVGPDDEVYVLGDAAMGRRDETLEVFGQLSGKKYLVPGNHDYCGPWFKKAGVWAPVYAKYFELLPVETTTVIGGHEVTLCHFPFGTADHTDSPRFLRWRPEDTGQWLVHGHTHGHLGRLHDGRQVDVGVEAWDWGPASEEQLAELIEMG